eukprot:TRINITY_DN47493_c0_g1_i1.p3 TRINITY_DN47493_c0_g1~~TRINITY_DN47493_c0_g1_i1.p3  ORF type:complete len:155 (+),score=24.33 TRINITY_DN47493_c0_g1_i1:32-496(+)
MSIGFLCCMPRRPPRSTLSSSSAASDVYKRQIIPEQYMGDVIGDITGRRGRIEGMEARMGEQSVHAFVPLSEMFGYATDLRSRTQGRGLFTMQFDHYEQVPKSIAEKITGRKDMQRIVTNCNEIIVWRCRQWQVSHETELFWLAPSASSATTTP